MENTVTLSEELVHKLVEVLHGTGTEEAVEVLWELAEVAEHQGIHVLTWNPAIFD